MMSALRRTSLLLLASTVTAMAHDTWLLPTHASVPVGTRVRFAMTSAGQFPTPESAITLDRLVRPQTEVRLGGTAAALRVSASQVARVTTFEHEMDRDGIATVFATLKPTTLTLEPSTVAHYLDEVGASAAVREQWAGSAARPWRETYTKSMKTFVSVGAPGADSSWRDPVGQAFEFVPLNDPTTLRAGDSLRVRVLLCGTALPGAPIAQQRAGSRRQRMVTTDADGTIVLPFESAGAWLVKATWIARRGQEPVCLTGDADAWHSAFSTLTIGVRSAARRAR